MGKDFVRGEPYILILLNGCCLIFQNNGRAFILPKDETTSKEGSIFLTGS